MANKIFAGTIISTAILLLVIVGGISLLPQALGTTTNTNWIVYVGGQSPDMSVMTMGYFPEIITIDAGDSVTWILNSTEPHTVTFLSGNAPLNPFLPQSLQPIGGNTYNGTGIVSSGLMFQGQEYTLTFTNPGVYLYGCVIHPGMEGVVIVNPSGTPYPFTQAQYNQMGNLQNLNALSEGQSLLDQVNLPTTPGPNGSLIWHVDAGLQIPVDTLVPISPLNNSKVTGTAEISITEPNLLNVVATLQGLSSGQTYNLSIYMGVTGFGGKILYNLNPVKASSNGTGTSTTSLNISSLSPYLPTDFGLPSAGWFIGVSSSGEIISGGNIIYPVASVMRFLPTVLTINVGDTVQWTQLDPMEIHTITFVPQGMSIPEFGTPISLTPSGGKFFNGSGYYNSGPLVAYQTYSLTFLVPGIFTYVCTLHDSMGMVGTIIVLPKQNSGYGTLFNQLNNTLSNYFNNLSKGASLENVNVSNELSHLNNDISTLSNGLSSLNNTQAAYQSSLNSKLSELYTLIGILIALTVISLAMSIGLLIRRKT